MVRALPLLLTVTLFLSILLTLSRMARDHEIVVWQTAGVGMTAWVRPVMQVSAPVFIAIAIISLALSPWSVRKSGEYRQQLESREDISAISPGVFKESKQNERVYFVESLGTSQATVKNVFVRSEQQGQLGIMVAQQGAQFIQKNGDRFLVLENGRRYEGTAGQADYRIMKFQRYTIRIEPYEVKLGVPSTKALPTLELFRDRTLVKDAELHWRLSLLVSTILLALLAIPLSFYNPRSGRSFAIAHASVLNGKLSPWLGVWSTHLIMLLAITFFYYRRQSVKPLFSWKRK